METLGYMDQMMDDFLRLLVHMMIKDDEQKLVEAVRAARTARGLPTKARKPASFGTRYRWMLERVSTVVARAEARLMQVAVQKCMPCK